MSESRDFLHSTTAFMPILFFIVLLMTTLSALTETPFYLGTVTGKTESKGIYRGTLNAETGELGPVTFAAEAEEPGFLAVSRDGRFVYAALHLVPAVAAYAVQESGELKFLNSQPAGGAVCCHVWLDSKNRYVLAANYTGGSVVCLPLLPDGSLAPQSDFVQFTGSGPIPVRQAGPRAHGIYTDARNRFVYVCDLGTDKVWSFRFDEEKGTLTPTDPPAADVTPGGGPRHLALHPSGKFAYANHEIDMAVTAFAVDSETGTLTPLQTLSTLPEGVEVTSALSTSEIEIHPTGRWLYVSNRVHDSLTVYAVGEDGRLTWVENVPSLVRVPRGMGIDPSGRWLVAAGQDDHRLVTFRIDPDAGRLTFSGHETPAPAPICVAFSPGLIRK